MVDTVREGTDTTATLAVGALVSGTIDAEPISGDGVTSDNAGGFVDKDWYQVTLSKGHLYTFNGSSTSLTTGSVAFSLRDSSGNPINGIYHNEAFQYVEGESESFTFDSSFQTNVLQTYYVAVSTGGADPAWRTATGDYKISVTDGGAPDTSSSPTSFTGIQLVAIAKQHLRETYLDDLPPLGKTNYNDPDYHGPWDCSEFASWCVYQASGKTLKVGVDSAWNAFSGSWQKDALAGKTNILPSERSDARRQAIKGPIPISSSSGSPKLCRKKL